MRYVFFGGVVSTLLWSTAYAGDKPNIGPPPAWVKPVSLPSAPPASDGAPIRILLSDQQIEFQPGRQTVYTDSAVRIQTPQGLAVGNLSFPWRPDTDDITVHKLVIRRGDKVIDVLASGQTFTVIRREQNLESATLDGMLTANIQPEGLEVGDVLEFAASITSSDPTLKSHVEQVAGAWNGAPVDHAHIRVKWPSTLPVRLRENGTLPPLKPVTENGVTAIDLSIDDLKPVIPPKGAPPRYGIGRALEFTDFKSWADLGALLAPLYQKAAIVGAQGPLRTELERIRQLSPDPKLRAQAALALVQDRIRYVALAMGAGGLVPADAETTWARRYGDCKAKTALLLALLHELGMEAEPVAVNASGGDGIDRRLPMIGLFDHVLVRATIDGKAYWLDGTRLGDASLDRVAVPDFGWGLPLVPAGAALVRILPPPLEVPAVSTSIHMDASGGLMTPAPTQIETVMRGDAAIALNLTLSGLTGETRDTALRQYWRGEYDFIDVKKADATFDPKTGEERLSMEGAARMDWSSGLYETDGTGLGYKADFSRDPGPDQDAPFATPYPFFTRTVETIVMPPNTAIPAGDFKGDVDETVAGVQYHRHATVSGPTITVDASQRSIAPEFPAKDAPAAQQKLRELANQAVAITKPRDYQATAADIKALVTSNPTTASEFESRGSAFLDQSKFDEALADFEHAVSLDPRSASALADRGLAHVWKSQFEPAAKDLDAANAIDPKNAVVFRARGLMAQKKGDNREAIAAFTKALDIEPGNTFALAHRAEVDYAAGELEAALSDAAEVLKRSPKLVASYLLRSTILIRQGKPDAAATEADALVAAMPDNSYAQVAAGNIYATVHKEAQAMRAFDRAIAIKPEGYIYLNRALHRPKSDLTGRRTDVDTAMAMDPKLTQAVSAKADLQVEQGDFAGAAATYSKRLEGTPEDLGLLTGRGIVYARAGDGVRADKDFAAVRAKAAQPGVLNNLCWAKATAGVALDSALDDCNAALAKAPDNPSFLDSRGLVFLRLGRFDDAIADYDRALKTRPTQPTSLFGRAVAWARKGDTAKSDADVVAAQKADSAVRATFERYGVKLR